MYQHCICGRTLLGFQAGLLKRTCSSWFHPPRFDMTQSEIDSLPWAAFPGEVVVVAGPRDEKRHRQKVATIRCSTLLGMDVEKLFHTSRSSFSRNTCVVQLATERLCVVWHVQRNRKVSHARTGILWFSSVLEDILCSPSILKVLIFSGAYITTDPPHILVEL